MGTPPQWRLCSRPNVGLCSCTSPCRCMPPPSSIIFAARLKRFKTERNETMHRRTWGAVEGGTHTHTSFQPSCGGVQARPVSLRDFVLPRCDTYAMCMPSENAVVCPSLFQLLFCKIALLTRSIALSSLSLLPSPAPSHRGDAIDQPRRQGAHPNVSSSNRIE